MGMLQAASIIRRIIPVAAVSMKGREIARTKRLAKMDIGTGRKGIAGMDYKATAAEIYALPHHKRHARLMEIPVGDRGMVRAYMDQLARIAQEENRRNNVKNNRRYMDKICGRKE